MVKETKNTKKKNAKTTKVVKKDVKKKVTTKKKETVKPVKKEGWFKSVITEVSKVKWPSKKELVKYSLVTIVFIIFFALFFYAIELLVALLKSLV